VRERGFRANTHFHHRRVVQREGRPVGRPVTDGQAERASARGHGTEMALHVKFHDDGSRAFARRQATAT
jgi:hypothetical protein